MASRSLPGASLAGQHQISEEDFAARLERSRRSFMQSNLRCVCHLPGCEVATADPAVFFCDAHQRLNQLSNALYAQGHIYPEARRSLTAVYLVGSRKAGAVKIGVADSVMDRVAALQTASPVKIEIFGAIYTLRDHAFKIERACHDKLREFGFHLSGEWFDAEPEDAYKVIAKMADTLHLGWIAPGKYIDMIANHGAHRLDVTHYAPDVRLVASAMLATSILPPFSGAARR